MVFKRALSLVAAHVLEERFEFGGLLKVKAHDRTHVHKIHFHIIK